MNVVFTPRPRGNVRQPFAPRRPPSLGAASLMCLICGCPPSDWLSVQFVARKLGICEKGVIRKVRAGELWGRQFGRLWRIRHRGCDADGIPGLDEYLEADAPLAPRTAHD